MTGKKREKGKEKEKEKVILVVLWGDGRLEWRKEKNKKTPAGLLTRFLLPLSTSRPHALVRKLDDASASFHHRPMKRPRRLRRKEKK